MKILDLVLKGVYYDMIDSGEKPEEYRKFKPYWIKRLCDNPVFDVNDNLIGRQNIDDYTIKMCEQERLNLIEMFSEGNMIPKEFTHVRLRRGYTSTTMLLKCEGISIGKGNPAWGAPEEEVFIIKLGERI